MKDAVLKRMEMDATRGKDESTIGAVGNLDDAGNRREYERTVGTVFHQHSAHRTNKVKPNLTTSSNANECILRSEFETAMLNCTLLNVDIKWANVSVQFSGEPEYVRLVCKRYNFGHGKSRLRADWAARGRGCSAPFPASCTTAGCVFQQWQRLPRLSSGR